LNTLATPYAQTVTVAKSGGDYTTIQAAINYCATQTPSTTKRFCVLVYPGDYAETITGSNYVEIMGLAAREAVNITGATGPLYTFPDNEGHIFNLKFTLTPTTAAEEIIHIPATVSARQVISNCLFIIQCASDVASTVFNIDGGEAEFVLNKIIFNNTNTAAAGSIRTQRVWDVDGNAIIDLYRNVIDVSVASLDERVLIFDDASTSGGEIFITSNIVNVNCLNAGAYSGIVRFISYVGTVTTLHCAHNSVILHSAETGGTGVAEFIRVNSAAGGATVTSSANHARIDGFATNRWGNVAAGDVLVSHFDDFAAVDGFTGAGTATYANSLSDGTIAATSSITGATLHAGEAFFGGASNYSQFETDGTLVAKGNATVWNDANVGAAMLSLPAAGQPDEDEYVDENGDDTGISTWAYAIGEKSSGSIEIPHDYKEGSDLYFHLHWQGIAAPAGGTDNVNWQLTYTVGQFNEALGAPATITKEIAIDVQYDFKITAFDAITGTNFNMGDQFLFTIERIAASADDYAGDCLVSTVGLHYECDTLGSRQITAK